METNIVDDILNGEFLERIHQHLDSDVNSIGPVLRNALHISRRRHKVQVVQDVLGYRFVVVDLVLIG